MSIQVIFAFLLLPILIAFYESILNTAQGIKNTKNIFKKFTTISLKSRLLITVPVLMLTSVIFIIQLVPKISVLYYNNIVLTAISYTLALTLIQVIFTIISIFLFYCIDYYQEKFSAIKKTLIFVVKNPIKILYLSVFFFINKLLYFGGFVAIYTLIITPIELLQKYKTLKLVYGIPGICILSVITILLLMHYLSMTSTYMSKFYVNYCNTNRAET